MKPIRNAITDLTDQQQAGRSTSAQSRPTQTSSDYGLELYNSDLRKAARAGDEFLHSAKHSPAWLTLLGVSGTGKTHLAKELYKRYKEGMIRKPCSRSAAGWREVAAKKQFFSWPKVMQKMRSGDWGIIDYIIRDVEFAVIDDLGSGYDTALSKNKASEIASGRLGKPTIWTSNLSLESIAADIDTRISSRMIRGNNRVVSLRDTCDYFTR